MGVLRILFVSVFIGCASARPSKVDTCGYQSCNLGKPGFINVHLLPHTHDDVGWLKTVDQYYYGARNNIQQAGVQYIIDSVITELSLDPSRRFIYVEAAFFHQWWVEQNEETQNLVKELVNNGRLEFINGGWCMNDEAATHYVDIIDQMSLGLGILSDTFGECGRPRVAWQIDPFGHSREQASLVAQMGYDGLFFGRLDYADKRKRMQDKTMEMVWQGSRSLGDAASIFTGVLYNTYFSPSGFCFDILCNDQPIIDDPESRDYNVDERVNAFVNFTQRQADAYATDHVLVTMGSDFTYQDANVWYKNMDKLIKYANARQSSGSRFNLFYSTPSCYLKALNDAGQTWPVKTDDFFPYGSDPHAYWTGYFTSRPSSKYMIRHSSNLLQTCKQAATFLALSGATNAGEYSILKEEVAVNQHHDAATGTEKQHVADDYSRRLDIGVVECHKTIASHYQKALPLGATALPQVEFCKLLNMSQCSTTENNSQFVVNVHNGLAKMRDQFVRVPVIQGSYEVRDPQGTVITSQLVPLPSYILNLPGRDSSATHELVFRASQLPPAGLKSYFVQRTAISHQASPQSEKAPGNNRADSMISNGRVIVTVDEVTGHIKTVVVDGKAYALKQQFLWYEGFNGDNSAAEKRASGAYIFRPTTEEPKEISSTATVTAIYTGPLVQEIHQTFGSWVGQTIRLYQDQDHVELDWTVGPIPALDLAGKEIISHFSTEIDNNGDFFTDANGRQNVKRTRNFRETWTYNVTEPVSGNYYPINSHIFFHDGTAQLTLVNDRAQGGGSLKDGELEIMVHRRLLHDDAFGVDEALDETQFGIARGLVARGTHYVILSDVSSAASHYRPLAQHLYRQPQLSFIPTTLSFAQWSALYKTQDQRVKALPENVNMLTLEPRSDGKSFLLRLEHMYDEQEDATLSQPVTVSIPDLLTGYTITDAQEMMLGANQLKSESNRLSWNIQPQSNEIMSDKIVYEYKPLAVTDVVLKPMEIRTFVISVV